MMDGQARLWSPHSTDPWSSDNVLRFDWRI